MALIAQLTDPHFRDDGADPCHDPVAAMRQAFAQIAGMDRKPDAIVLTGDVIDRSAKGYAHAIPVLREAPVPLLPMPGNHDNPAGFRAAFAEWAAFAPDHLSFTTQIAGLHLIAIDSNLPDGGAGLDATRLDWLASACAAAQGPAILALHHPPFPTFAPHLDRPGFQNASALSRLLKGSAVCRIIAGHSHRAMHTVWANCLASTAPPIGYGLSLSLSGAESHSPEGVSPAFDLHLANGGTMVSHQIKLG
ncbi:metallophosphoesterase family protein [Halodurantibacterium flavum]|uniref:Metallophosphoesterase family protein n=1 Tax=Halodurantibacterium flavum TaxID=1382802 RepID=A0ABW4RZE7_9RHOB